MNNAENDAHSTHCCARHGCKYGDPFCTVILNLVPQEYPCEDCPNEDDLREAFRHYQEVLADYHFASII